MLRIYGGVCLVVMLLLVCTPDPVDRAFVTYLQQERILRQTVENENALSDSLRALEQRLGVDRARKLARVSDQPEHWLLLLEALENTQ